MAGLFIPAIIIAVMYQRFLLASKYAVDGHDAPVYALELSRFRIYVGGWQGLF